MKNEVIFIAFICFNGVASYGQAVFEQYYYFQEKTPVTFVPIVHVQSRDNWYAEVRYNYEEANTFAVYGGKSFSNEKGALSYELIPILGRVFGEFNGGSIGLNAALEYKDFYFSSQSQYTSSFDFRCPNFLYTWLELGFEPLDWFYFGGSLQQTSYFRPGLGVMEPGVVLGFSLGVFTFPLYTFSPLNEERYFIVGINYGFGKNK